MNIENLANEIQDQALEIIRKEESIDTEKKAIASFTELVESQVIEIEKQVLFNENYKNESQRKLAIKEAVEDSEFIREDKIRINKSEEKIIDLEFEIKRIKIKKNYLETMLKLEFIKLEKGV